MYMYDCIILDGRGCDVTIAMCNNKTLTPERKTKKKKGVKNNQLITQKQSVPSQSVLSQLLTFLLLPSSYPAWQEPPG